MTKPELGTKRICAGCNVKFYDLHKSPIVCPACEAVFVLPKPVPERPRRAFEERPQPVPVVAAPNSMPTPKSTHAGDEAASSTDDADGEKETDAAGVPLLEELDED